MSGKYTMNHDCIVLGSVTTLFLSYVLSHISDHYLYEALTSEVHLQSAVIVLFFYSFCCSVPTSAYLFLFLLVFSYYYLFIVPFYLYCS